ncbi:MAG: class I SAM-dependent methyltransferase [Bacteroidales bacterium]|nr:class I SAM-dependent methyltransferase [Bacteroidales bacterium]
METFENSEGDNRCSCDLAETFGSIKGNLTVAEIIREQSVNKTDIREFALENLDLSHAKRILDLGCGFGFFTRGLKGKVHPEAEICGIELHSRYRDIYLEACGESGIRGEFISGGVQKIKEIDSNRYDLILCSFALCFFPAFIKDISRILRENGVFVVIVHAEPHLQELTSMVKNILKDEGINMPEQLPYEKLVSHFSDKNGEKLLLPYFSRIIGREYRNALLFKRGDEQAFEKYFISKRIFFLPEEYGNTGRVFQIILKRIKNTIQEKGLLEISKKDIVYICSEPVKK